MLTCSPLENSIPIQHLHYKYLYSLIAPIDGMWESIITNQAVFWEIRDQDQPVGYFYLDAGRTLLRFHLWENYLHRLQEIFQWVVSVNNIQYAIASTLEPAYLSLCLDLQRSLIVHSYLFRDYRRVEPPADLRQYLFRKADILEVDVLIEFYQANTEGLGEWIEGFLHRRLDREELFVLF